jgi:hypothetical protein
LISMAEAWLASVMHGRHPGCIVSPRPSFKAVSQFDYDYIAACSVLDTVMLVIRFLLLSTSNAVVSQK